MIQIILMLFGLAFPNNNANTVTSDNNQPPVTIVNQSEPLYPDGPIGGNSGQTPPPNP
ncbi:hypothetical protein [Chryseobacterium sp. YR221]|jgi:hypothetical protein|uniref:Uncharacterized protein n=1 Tax=Chryseobacterium rhizosphaerae TaxID=395937 RepID=A0AAE3Y6X8_9FLAO|nr:hypothetical protein [Chryseobacterium sp. YR221]MDR6526528.1 hypothetical protein [Chryseobacterium rhizosphaerae]SMC91620.1 hypothetical protein SAMN02787074_3742 [Chryseobacterium sp. YR221]